MVTLLTVLILVLVSDQAIKLLVRTRIAHRPVSLGILGSVRMVHGKIWSMGASRGWSLGAMWIVWLACAGVSGVICALAPDFGLSLGLLLGGALSHAIETSMRGSICDYVCLRFWPAFNLADVALVAGAIGFVIDAASAGS
jgi:lipoprotein signal peptidase